VVINDLRDSTFFAQIRVITGERTLELDARPSDAIALALRTAAPIFVEQTLAGGFFVIEHLESRHLVSSCLAMRGGGRGQLGWLVTDPSHARKGLGTIVAASATNRLLSEGYAEPFLGTEDFRIVAIGIYLDLGWRPDLDWPDVKSRWSAIREQLVKLKPLNDHYGRQSKRRSR